MLRSYWSWKIFHMYRWICFVKQFLKYAYYSILSDYFWPKIVGKWSKLQKFVIIVLVTHSFSGVHILIFDLMNIKNVFRFFLDSPDFTIMNLFFRALSSAIYTGFGTYKFCLLFSVFYVAVKLTGTKHKTSGIVGNK